jgi:hypothetical protein
VSKRLVLVWGFVSLVGVAAACEYGRVPTSREALSRVPDALKAPGGAVSSRVASALWVESATPGDPGLLARGGSLNEARFPKPRAVRGLYVNAWAAGSSTRMSELLDIALRTEINSLVIDIKDASGYLSHTTEVALAHEIGATEEIRIRDLPGLLSRLEQERLYPIARIVIVKDPILVEFRPELAVSDTAGGVWVDSKGLVWLNPYSRKVWDYHVDIAREVALLGFPEIQFDYVRFPDAPEEDLGRAVFRGAEGRSKSTAIGEFLEYAREALDDLDVQVTADVFGVTTSARRDVGIGQVWETMISAVDVALPMVYPSHYWEGSFGFEVPNAHPYEIVRRAVTDAVQRAELVEGAGRTRPWLQDFTLGAPPYTSAEVRAQIQATYDAGVDEWILWNPSSRYTESALEPVAGFTAEPLIRIAGRLAPVSERFAVLDSVAAKRGSTGSPAPAAAARQDASPAEHAPASPAASDTVGAPLD